ncbi:DUF2637 domain-containing protein [Streptosporangium saharense]|uniref:Pyruvate/2-oxoglutarate dehydrogenase complex dihydrolipoamide acyltransferase (E2) component n=1 Tax=Streptosporangium saharense TaxID=1706840 RepID=A0A7W7QW57_9ACTN|nr:DUF2637 domain-containing protein [Streptosporangium saharense]MBB4920883.1 pyruvate/2-oxoglutarate dehydrogenase complex dihydrolipoamide acyltransferase (E2) component [Streptosporangium saharense]
MFNISLRRRNRADDGERPVNGHDHEIQPLTPWTGGDGVREIRHYRVSPRATANEAGSDRKAGPGGRLAGGLLVAAGVIIAAALVGAGYVSYEAQRKFAAAHLTDQADADLAARIIAALPDAGWIAMALVALVAALLGRSSARARLGVVLFFALSLGAQLMYAPRTPEGILVAVIAPVALAWMLESLIVEVRRWAAARQGLDIAETPILTAVAGGLWRLLRGLVGLLLWGVRLLLDKRGTWGGVRDWVLDTAPLAPGRTRASMAAAAALEQAVSAEKQAELERAHAGELVERERTEMAARLDQMEAQVRAEREQLQEAQQDLDRRLAETEQAARAEVRAAADAEVADLQTALAEIRAEIHRERTRFAAEVSSVREAERAEARALADRMQADLDRAHRQLNAQREECARLAELASVPTGRARLIALYDRLQGVDSRYGDPAQAAALARELYEQAGLKSEGTARTYLYEHIKSGLTARMSVAGGIIETQGVSHE